MTTKAQVWRVFVRSMHEMSFAQIFHKSNSSFSPLRGATVECTVRPLQQNMVTVDTGLKSPVMCFQNELGRSVTENTKLPFGVERLESFGEPKMVLPKELERKSRVKQVWTELARIWQSDRNLVKGFVMNRVNGGYAVAIAGYICFVPRSLLASKRISSHNPWKMFNIIGMNAKIGNIVVKEAPRLGSLPKTFLATWNNGKQPRVPGLSDSGFRQNDGRRSSGFPVSGLPSNLNDQARQPLRRPQPLRKVRPRVLATERSDTSAARSLSQFFLQ